MRLFDLFEAQPTMLTPAMMKQIRAWRKQCRIDNGGGGMCHEVSEIIENEWGWERLSGTYCHKTSDGDPICDGHYWNIMPDGSILDSTADQIGEDDIRIIRPDDPAHQQYRPEWYADYHPGHPDFAQDDPVHQYKWSGEYDFEWSQANERPAGWWITDVKKLKSLLQYYKTQLAYAKPPYGEHYSRAIKELESRIKELETAGE